MKGVISMIPLLFCFPPRTSFGQNLCINGNFESYAAPPTTYAQICNASGWNTPSGTCSLVPGTGSPDYYHSAGSGGAQPPATWWATISPHSGGGMAGFATWYSSNNYREYISRQLSAPLVVGLTYQIELWVSNGISWLHLVGTDNIGINFSLSPLVQSLGSPILLTPQLETTYILYDTSWKRISFTYVATAPYQYITIGNFHTDANTQTQSFGSGSYANYGAYYYVDDIIIQPAAPLPVEWLYVDAAFRDGVQRITWATASESGSDYFEVEKSLDGSSFVAIGKVQAAGFASWISTYAFDDMAFEASCYYRIRQVDLNGGAAFSQVVYAMYDPETKDTLQAHVDHHSLVVEGYASVKSRLSVALYTVEGRLALPLFTTEVSHRFAEKLTLEGLPPGIYVVYAVMHDRVLRQKTTWP